MSGRVVLPNRVRWVTTAATPRGEWLEARAAGLGGSDVAAIVSASPFRSPFDVWLDKTGRDRGRPVGEAAEWGQVLEDAVARRWAAREGLRLRRLGMVADLAHPWRMASLDRAVLVPGPGLRAAALVEIKTTSQRSAEQLDDDTLQARYTHQVQWYLAVTGLTVGHLVVLVGGQRLRHIEVRANPGHQAELQEAADAFWRDHVQADVPPPLTHVDYERTRRTPAADPLIPPVVASTDLLRDVAELRIHGAAKRALEEREKELKARLQQEMGGAAELVDPAGATVATWAATTRRSVDMDRLLLDHPDLAGLVEEYRTTTVVRQFKVKKES